jgi:type I restriction enzyme, S subunit
MSSDRLSTVNSQVSQGYKQTEVGLIPEDWEVVPIHELVKDGPKNGYSGRSGKDSRGTPTLSLSATSSGHLILNQETIKFLEENISPDSDLFLRFDDVLVQRSNTIDLVGTTAVFNGSPKTYIYPDLMMRLRFRERNTAQWFWRYANSKDGRKFFSSVAAGSSGSMPKISGDRLRRMPIPLPPKSHRLPRATHRQKTPHQTRRDARIVAT